MLIINSKQNFNLLSDEDKKRVIFFLTDTYTEENVFIKYDNEYLSLNDATDCEVEERQNRYYDRTILLNIIRG